MNYNNKCPRMQVIEFILINGFKILKTNDLQKIIYTTQYDFVCGTKYISNNISLILPSFYKFEFAGFTQTLKLYTKISKNHHIQFMFNYVVKKYISINFF